MRVERTDPAQTDQEPHLRTGEHSLGRIIKALVALLLIASCCLAQLQDARDSQTSYWIVLLDTSVSSENRDRALGESLGFSGYRLRNEILTLMQTLLAVKRERAQNLENDFLDVFVFGTHVKRLSTSPGPVRWGGVQSEDYWNQLIPTDLGSGSDYLGAIHRAAELFKAQHQVTKKNLLIISDGELDVGTAHRIYREAPEKDELEIYRNFLRVDNPLLRWLAENDVSVFTLTLSEDLTGFNDTVLSKQIGRRLYQTRLGGASPLERALSVVEDSAGRAGPDGRLPFSEGPYVMRALADFFGGEARLVRYDNILDVLWEIVFPDQEHRRLILPPGTKKVIVLAPIDSAIQVRIEKGGRKEDVSLEYDKERTSYRLTPPEANLDMVNVRATSQYATWLIVSQNLAEVNLRSGDTRAFAQPSLMPVNNVRFEWQEGEPPERTTAGAEVDLALNLIWKPELEGPSREEWRRQLVTVPHRASARVALPGGGIIEVPLGVDIAQDSSDRVLRLRGRFGKTRSVGTYEISALLAAGSEIDTWQLRARPVRFRVLADSPLAKPDRFTLAVRRLGPDGSSSGVVTIHPPTPGREGKPVRIETSAPAKLVFEWWSEVIEDGCDPVKQLELEIPELDRLFGPSGNILGKPLLEADHRVCYRSPPEVLRADAFQDVLTVRASDGLTSWERRLRLVPPRPFSQRIVRWLSLTLLAFLLLATFALVLIPELRRSWFGWLGRKRADFPLAVDKPNGETIVWEPGSSAKRFLIYRDSEGQVHVEITSRRLDPGEQGFEVRPYRADEYQVRLLAGSYWNLRRVTPTPMTSRAQPLGPDGVVVTFLELVRGTRIEVEHQGTTVRIHHRSR